MLSDFQTSCEFPFKIFRRFFVVACVLMYGFLAKAQTPGEWTWMHGDSTPMQPAVFGTMGVPDPANKPAGVYEGTEWVDLSGLFYFFGGLAQTYTLADMWRYNPATNEWTWLNGPGGSVMTPVYGIRGVPSPINHPGDRGFGMLSWVDSPGNLWMYGGYSTLANAYRSDLWKYNPATNEWTWMSGDTIPNSTGNHGIMGIPSPTNVPPGVGETACAFREGDNLWFYAGMSNGPYIGSLWRYSISNDEWTWMKGDTSYGAPPVYGTQGVSSPAGFPGARMCYTHWLDLNGDFWIFGGVTTSGYNNDMWRYSVLTNEWTWMDGPNTTYDSGLFGLKCSQAAANRPPPRVEGRSCWTDACGNFWLFAGNVPNGAANDLWKYDPLTGMWTWVSGDTIPGTSAVFGTKGVSAPSNNPAPRLGSHPFKESNGNLFAFGGFGPNGFLLNDLWRFVPDTTCTPCLAGPQALFSSPNEVCPGACIDFTNLSVNAGSYQWFFPGANPSGSNDSDPLSICYSTPGSYDVTLIAGNGISSDTLLISNYITVFPSPSPQSITQSGDTLFANQGAASYQWYFNNTLITGATNYFYVAPSSGNYNIVATDSNGCEVEAVIFDVIASIEVMQTHGQVLIFPNPVSDELTITFPENTAPSRYQMIIYSIPGEVVSIKNDQEPVLTVDVSGFSKGIYWLEILTGEKIFRGRFVKQ